MLVSSLQMELHVSSRSEFNMDHVKNFCPDFQSLTAEQISSFLPHRFKYGCQYTTIIVDPGFYLKWLMDHALTKCNLIVRRIDSLEKDPILSDYDIIVNCSGLSARDLAGDDRLIPVRGQTITVHAPWIKMFTWADGAYIYPKADGNVTLGGIKQFGSSNPDVDQSDKDWIWDRCTELQPSLKNCQILYDWVGLRPFRQPIRVESEVLSNGRKVVHNYGHGGNGYTYSYGTAMEATALVKGLLDTKLKSKL
jgi:hypothetical protein